MTEILLIRHPETELAGTFCGHSNPPINAPGQAQLANLLETLQGELLEAVYTSDLERAQVLAQAIAAAHQIPCHIQPALREMHFGRWEGLTWSQVEQRTPDQAASWLAHYPHHPAPAGELFAHFQPSILEALDRILDAPQQNIAIVTHAGVIRTILTQRCNIDEATAWTLTKPYCSLVRCSPARGGAALSHSLSTLELIAWDLDAYPFRSMLPDQSCARQCVAERSAFAAASALCEDETNLLHDQLDQHRSRPDLQAEMHGLDWNLGIIDLRKLIAFQRRLTFNPDLPPIRPPLPADWVSLLQIAFAEAYPATYTRTQTDNAVILQSSNPNLHLRPGQAFTNLLEVHAGSPFFEVALYRGRWFLRDGYHRAYALLQAGVFHLPAVIVNARTLEELGATSPRFFSDEVLFSHHPPMLTDFLNPALTFTYTRPPTLTTLRITWEESITPAGDLA